MSPHSGAQDGEGPEHRAFGSGDDEARRRRLLGLLGETAGGDQHGRSGTLIRLARLCEVSVSEVGVDGAGVTVLGSVDGGLNGERDQLAATDELTRRLDELQLTAGEGPCLDAYRNGLPVLVGDLAAEPSRWLGFGPEAARAGAGALFSLPLQVGAVALGTLDLYRAAAGPLSREQLADALILAALATESLLVELAEHPVTETDHAPTAWGWLPDVHADVHVAAGMLAARWDVGVATALLGLRAHAFTRSEPLHDLARRIIDRDLVLDHPTAHAPGPGHTDPSDPPDWPPAPDPENDDP